MLTLEPINNNHLVSFDPIPIQDEEFKFLCEMLYGREDKHNFCFLDKGKPVLFIGMHEKWDKVFDTYIVFSSSWRLIHYRGATRLAKKYLQQMEYDRIEHLCHCDRGWTGRMAEMFGFKEGPIMRKYVNGKDFKLFEIVRD